MTALRTAGKYTGIFSLAIVLMMVLTACGGTPTKSGMPWWPQGPGNAEEAAPAGSPDKQTDKRSSAPISETTVDSAAAASASSQGGQPATRIATAGQDAAGSYTQARRYGDLLFLSGQIAVEATQSRTANDNPVESQTQAVMKKIQKILEGERLTMTNIVQTTLYLADINQLGAVNTVYEQYFSGPLPARSVVEVARLPRGALVQIAVIAGR